MGLDLPSVTCKHWKLGNPTTPTLRAVQRLQWLKATKMELEIIRRDLTGIPMVTKQKEVTWYGDDARFILRFFIDYFGHNSSMIEEEEEAGL